MDQAREGVPGWPHEDWLGDRVKLTLLRAPDDELHQHPTLQAEIKEFDSALKDGGVESEALWLTQDFVGGWCGYVGVIIVAAGATIKAARPIIIAYIKLRTGRKVQVECDGLKLKIDEATDEEVDRILTLVEQRHKTNRQKKQTFSIEDAGSLIRALGAKFKIFATAILGQKSGPLREMSAGAKQGHRTV